jgi:NAD(P) transhydrogenase subunit alpha
MYLGDAKQSVDKLNALLGELKPVEEKAAENGSKGDIEAPDLPRNRANSLEEFLEQVPSLQDKTFLNVGVIKEVEEGESRVAIVPNTVKNLLKFGVQVYIESDAGVGGGFYDGEYENSGAKIMPSSQAVFDTAEVIVKIREPTKHPVTKKHELEMLASGKSMISFVGPRTDAGKALMEKAKAAGLNLLAVDAIPRISRAQSLDVLSSQAKIAGYRAVIEAANIYQRFFNGEITAAGNFQAAKVLVIGVGVAGLAAIGTAANMGAVVRAFDTRLETKEQVESMGGEFLVLDFKDEDGGDAAGYAKVMSDAFYKKEMELFRDQAHECQIIITTAAIPGRPAPKLVMKDAVDAMQPGSVIVDLAGATGGNCELTRPGETYVYDDRVTIIGTTDLISKMAWQASSMYSNNMANLIELLCAKKENDDPPKFCVNMEDPVIRGMTCVHNGEVTWPPPESVTKTSADKPKPQTTEKSERAPSDREIKAPPKESILKKRVWDLTTVGELVGLVSFATLMAIIGVYAHISFVQLLLFFILAAFLGYYLIWNVEPALFSPLMSTSNSLSGVVILGGILMASTEKGSATNVLGIMAIAVAAINVFGGFSVSYRMLLMFKKETD